MGAELWRSLDIFGIWNSLGNRVGVFFSDAGCPLALWIWAMWLQASSPFVTWVVGFGFSFLVYVLELFHLESQHALGFGMCPKYLQGMNRRCQNRALRESSSAKRWA